MFPPKAPKSMRDIRLGVQKTPGAAPGKSVQTTCPACGEALDLSVSKGAGAASPDGGDLDGDESGPVVPDRGGY